MPRCIFRLPVFHTQRKNYDTGVRRYYGKHLSLSPLGEVRTVFLHKNGAIHTFFHEKTHFF